MTKTVKCNLNNIADKPKSLTKSLTSSFPSSAKILPRLYLIDVTKTHKKYASKDM